MRAKLTVPKWKKNSPEQVARFDALCAVPGAERALLFGSPVYLLKGERYASLNQGHVVLRLPADDIAALLKKGGRPFEPIKGRRVKDRVVLPEAIVSDARALKAWVKKAAAFSVA